MNRFVTLFKEQNVKELAALFTEDCLVMPPGQDVRLGRFGLFIYIHAFVIFYISLSLSLNKNLKEGRVGECLYNLRIISVTVCFSYSNKSADSELYFFMKLFAITL